MHLHFETIRKNSLLLTPYSNSFKDRDNCVATFYVQVSGSWKLISRYNGVCVRFLPTKVIPDGEGRETLCETERDGKIEGRKGVKREEEGYDLRVFTTVYTESDSDSISVAAVT